MTKVRAIFVNRKNQNQLSFQLTTEVRVPMSGNSLIVAASQGIEKPGVNTLVTIISVAKDVAEKLGYEVGDYSKNPISLTPFEEEMSKINGKPVKVIIRAFENLVSNPFSKKQVPKQPGPNSTKVLCLDVVEDETGEKVKAPIYRHTFAGFEDEEGNTQTGLELAAAAGIDTSLAAHCTEKDGSYYLASTSRCEISELPDDIKARFGGVQAQSQTSGFKTKLQTADDGVSF